MDPITMLTREHRVIERVLTCLEIAAGRLEASQPVRPGTFMEIAEFIRDFVDDCHHRKEEAVLFPALECAGLSREGGPLGVLLLEHDDGRRYAAAMRAVAARVEAGDARAATELAQDAKAYVAVMRLHIHKEDSVLFPAAARMLTEQQQAAALAAFDAVDLERARTQVLARIEHLEEELDPEKALAG